MRDEELRTVVFEIINKNCEQLDSGGYCVLIDDIVDEIMLLILNHEI